MKTPAKAEGRIKILEKAVPPPEDTTQVPSATGTLLYLDDRLGQGADEEHDKVSARLTRATRFSRGELLVSG